MHKCYPHFQTCLSPARPLAPPPRDYHPPPPQGGPHWELGGPGSEGDLSGGSSKFNESWPSTETSMEQPSTKPGGGGGGGRGGDRKEREEQRERPDVSKYVVSVQLPLGC